MENVYCIFEKERYVPGDTLVSIHATAELATVECVRLNEDTTKPEDISYVIRLIGVKGTVKPKPPLVEVWRVRIGPKDAAWDSMELHGFYSTYGAARKARRFLYRLGDPETGEPITLETHRIVISSFEVDEVERDMRDDE